jgi:hypothetical protein
MQKPTQPQEKQPGETAKGKHEYDPVGMAGKTEGEDADRNKPGGHEETTHRREETQSEKR